MHGHQISEFLRRSWQAICSFAVGSAILLHEVFFTQPPTERPMLIAAGCALMGFPLVAQGDWRLRDGKTPEQAATEERKRRDERKARLEDELRRLKEGDGA